MDKTRMRRVALCAVLSAVLLALAACGDDNGGEDEETGGGAQGEDVTLTVYSGREEEFVGPLLDQFQEDECIELDVRYGDSAELAAQILEEGDAS
ncbi:MAG TPA: iron ABC transporter substrate-binding protein, partial [Actinomycetota bacterium]|nr:iron ABC transporter substrate-binding protein [Actinomycetota bacterium]